VIDRQRAAIQVIVLQGYLFFGSVHHLLESTEPRLAGTGDRRGGPRFLILDCARVDGADSSCLFALMRLRQQAEAGDCTVLWAAVPPGLLQALQAAGLAGVGQASLTFADLDHALEHAENRVLGIARTAAPQSGLDELEAAYPTLGVRRQLMAYCDRVIWRPGGHVLRQGAPSDAMFFLESGLLTAWRELPDGGRIRLRTIVPGTVIGEVGFYSASPHAASIVADQESSAYRITREALRRIQKDDPPLASTFHRFMVVVIAERAEDSINRLAACIQCG
jgi:SulP family sulfate permease